MATETKKEVKKHLLPVGRLINASLFEKDAFEGADGKPGTPSYKAEIAFDPKDVTGESADIEEAILDALEDKWGPAAADAYLDGKIIGPFLDGDKLAARREEKGKPGDAYKGKLVARMNTIYNREGLDGPGGAEVYDEAVKPITIVNRNAIYNGCIVQAAVTLYCYLDNRGDKAMKFYLAAVQKKADGEKLSSAKDSSTLFKPVEKPSGTADASTGRRRRG